MGGGGGGGEGSGLILVEKSGPSPGFATDIDGIITEFARLKGTHLALCFNDLDAVISPYLTDNTRDRWVK